jgi:hypothetical protein
VYPYRSRVSIGDGEAERETATTKGGITRRARTSGSAGTSYIGTSNTHANQRVILSSTTIDVGTFVSSKAPSASIGGVVTSSLAAGHCNIIISDITHRLAERLHQKMNKATTTTTALTASPLRQIAGAGGGVSAKQKYPTWYVYDPLP